MKKLFVSIFAALALAIPAVSSAQTISNYNQRWHDCLAPKFGLFSKATVAYHTTFNWQLWWDNVAYGPPYHDHYPGGGGNVKWVKTVNGNIVFDDMYWAYLTNPDGTVAPGSRGYGWTTGHSTSTELSNMSACSSYANQG